MVGLGGSRTARGTDKPNWAPMQQLYDAGLSYDPVSGMPVFDPRACAPALLTALWRGVRVPVLRLVEGECYSTRCQVVA